ncbi:MAG: hypothetical protein IJ109_10880 [Firmicutes bacterium]|nr:hypothetical protein [Bacillota bacterium]MBQ9016601.1 hypothetical protein [Bacillota bacterium]
MKIYHITDEYIRPYRVIGYLLYYEKQKAFAIELAEDLKEMDAPLFFASFLRRGIRSIDPVWSKRWVQQRIIPADRQNLGVILRTNRLKEYDEMKLLLLGEGRCAQDDCSVTEDRAGQLPAWMYRRMQEKLARVIPLSGMSILVSFAGEDLQARHIELQPVLREEQIERLQREERLFRSVRLQPGGQGICWGENLSIPSWRLLEEGTALPMTGKDLRMFQAEAMDTAAVCQRLNCSRQYVDRLVKEGRLSVVRESGHSRLYDPADVDRLTW